MPQNSLDQTVETAAAHHRAGRLEAAEAMYRQVLAVDPNHPAALNLLGVLARQLGHSQMALELVSRAVQLRPDQFMYRNNLAEILNGLGQHAQATPIARQLVDEHPDLHFGWQHLANSLYGQGELVEAAQAYERALSLNPHNPRTRMNYSLLLLLTGDFHRGWQEHEARLEIDEPGGPRQHFQQPRWRGEPLGGRRILLTLEQGFGDALQFVRYVPLVHENGGRVVLQTIPALTRLFQTVAGVEELAPRHAPPPDFDVHCPLMSLPYVLGTRIETIPTDVPYLVVDPSSVESWCARLAGISKRKIGLAWAGRATHEADRIRSIPLPTLAPLAALADRVQWVSLQLGPAAAQVGDLPQFQMLDFTQDLKDFADTAALMQNLDLVITVDTAVPHLAGALGKPVWVLLAYVPDWRWMLGRDDSPWYPTMRLFRQQAAGDWQSPIDQLMQAIS